MVLSGPCALPGSCVTSPNYPDNYGNSESCEILAPEKPLYFLRFATEEGDDVLTFNGQAYSGSSGPPQGTTTSDMILWSSDNVDSSTGWQMCTVHGVNHSGLSHKYFHIFCFLRSSSFVQFSLQLSSLPNHPVPVLTTSQPNAPMEELCCWREQRVVEVACWCCVGRLSG